MAAAGSAIRCTQHSATCRLGCGPAPWCWMPWTAALGLQCAALGTRMAGHRGTARALGAAGLTITVAAAYLGGHLVFTKGVMVSRVAWATGPRRWTRALLDADVPDDSPTVAEVEGR